MEKFKENVVKLNSNPAFIDVISAEEDAIKTQNTLISEAAEKGATKKQLEIAEKMFEKGADINLISEITGLSNNELEIVKENVVKLNSDPAFIDVINAEEDAIKTQNTLISEAAEKGATQKQLEIVKNLLQLNISLDDIAKATGLSKEKIETLK